MVKHLQIFSTLSIILLLILTGVVSAESQNLIESYDDPNWEQVVDDGFGSRDNAFAWSMEEYHGYLYVGTRTDCQRCQIHRSQTGDEDTWEQVIEDGFDEAFPSDGVRNMIVYKDLLWAVTDSWQYGTQVFVTDGEDDDHDGILNWKKANENGFGKGNEVQSSRSLRAYKDKLYIGARSSEGPLIYRYDGPTEFENIQPDNWSIINQEMLENPDHNPLQVLPGMMMNFTAKDGKEYLYLGIWEEPVPLFEEFLRTHKLKDLLKFLTYPFWKCEIWRYDGIIWEEIAEDGFGNINVAAISAQVLNGTLYFGTSNVLGIEMWKTSDGENWTQIIRRGFGQPLTQWLWRMHIYEDKLIFGTFNPIRGFQIWASTNDNPLSQEDFFQINMDGMGRGLFPLIKQDGVRVFETFKGHLYAGTASFMDFLIKRVKGTGCEVWRLEHLPEPP